MSICLELDMKLYLSFVFCVAQSASQVQVIRIWPVRFRWGLFYCLLRFLKKSLVIQTEVVIQKLKNKKNPNGMKIFSKFVSKKSKLKNIHNAFI